MKAELSFCCEVFDKEFLTFSCMADASCEVTVLACNFCYKSKTVASASSPVDDTERLSGFFSYCTGTL